jgi:hypothetical protein
VKQRDSGWASIPQAVIHVLIASRLDAESITTCREPLNLENAIAAGFGIPGEGRRTSAAGDHQRRGDRPLRFGVDYRSANAPGGSLRDRG